MMKKCCSNFMLFFVFSVVILCSCSRQQTYTLSADYPLYDTAEEIVDSADMVFTGKVVNIRYEMLDVKSEIGPDPLTGLVESDPIPYTIYEIQPIQFYKGETTQNSVCVKRPGGIFDGSSYILEDSAEIVINNEYLFVAEAFENSYASLINATQATYNLNEPSVISEENEITLADILMVFE